MRIKIFVTMFVVVLCACSDDNLGSGAGSSGANDDSDAGATTSADSGTNESHAACDAYLKCLTDTSPQEFPEALQAYGPNGTCWGNSASVAAECDSACAASMAQQAENYPDVASCGKSSGSTIDAATGESDDGGASFGSEPASFPGVQADCNDCMWSTCPGDETACLADSVCAGFYTCWAACGDDDTTCTNACQTPAVQSSDTINAINACISNSACGVTCIREIDPVK